MSTTIGEIKALLTANNEELLKKLAESSQATEKTSNSMSSSLKKAGGAFAAVAAAAAASAVAILKNVSEAAEEVTQLSNLAQVNALEFQKWSYAADFMGVTTAKLANDFRRINRITGVDGPTALRKLVEEGEKAGKSQQDIAGEMENLSKGASRLLPLLRDGAKGLEHLAEHAESSGTTMDDKTRKALQRVAVQSKFMAIQVDNLKTEIAAGLVPAFESISRAFDVYLADGVAVANLTGAMESSLKILVHAGTRVMSTFEQMAMTIKADTATIAAALKWNFGEAVEIQKQLAIDFEASEKRTAKILEELWSKSSESRKDTELSTVDFILKLQEDANKALIEGELRWQKEEIDTLDKTGAEIWRAYNSIIDFTYDFNAELEAANQERILAAAEGLEQGIINEQQYADLIRKSQEKLAQDKADYLEKEREVYEAHQATLRANALNFSLTEQERLAEEWAERLEALTEALQAEAITREEFNAGSLAAHQQYEEAMTAISQAEQQARLNGVERSGAELWRAYNSIIGFTYDFNEKLEAANLERILAAAEGLEQGIINEQQYAEIIIKSQEKLAQDKADYLEQEREVYEAHQATLRANALNFSLTEQERLAEEWAERLEALTEALQAEAITREEFNAGSLAAHQQYEEAMTAISQAEQQARLNGIQSALAAGATLMNSESKKLFNIGKAAAIANASIDMYSGVMKAWALGPIIGPPLAALVGAAGIANIGKIASTKYGGGAPAPAEQPQQSGTGFSDTMQQNVYLHGIERDSLYDGGQILDALNGQLESGGRLVIT